MDWKFGGNRPSAEVSEKFLQPNTAISPTATEKLVYFNETAAYVTLVGQCVLFLNRTMRQQSGNMWARIAKR